VLIAGRAAVSAAGSSVENLWDAVCEGRDGLRPADEAPYSTEGLRVASACWLPDALRGTLAGSEEAARLEPASGLLVRVADEALRSARLPAALQARSRWGLWVGTSLGGIGSWQAQHLAGMGSGAPVRTGLGYASPARDLARHLGVGGPVVTVTTACCSSTLAAIQAAEAVARGEVDVALACGVDLLCRFVHAGFDVLGALSPPAQRPFAADRDGLWLGEGAGVLVFRRPEPSEPGVQLLGGGLAGDALRLTGPDPTGSGLLRAVMQALEQADVGVEALQACSTHGTGTELNDAMEAVAFSRLLGSRVSKVPVHGIKPVLGHTLGASGIFELIVLERAMLEGRFPGTPGAGPDEPGAELWVHRGEPLELDLHTALSTNSAFAGNNAAAVLRRFA